MDDVVNTVHIQRSAASLAKNVLERVSVTTDISYRMVYTLVVQRFYSRVCMMSGNEPNRNFKKNMVWSMFLEASRLAVSDTESFINDLVSQGSIVDRNLHKKYEEALEDLYIQIGGKAPEYIDEVTSYRIHHE